MRDSERIWIWFYCKRCGNPFAQLSLFRFRAIYGGTKHSYAVINRIDNHTHIKCLYWPVPTDDPGVGYRRAAQLVSDLYNMIHTWGPENSVAN